jgi:hypothetical protein
MLHALRSLNPKHESLAPILKAIEPDFALGEKNVVPEAISGRHEPGETVRSAPFTDAELDLVQGVARQVMRKVFFLTAKIPVLLDRPQEWPAGEIERTVAQLVDLTLTLNRTQWMRGGRSALKMDGYGGRFFADPWRALAPGGVLPAAAKEALRRLAREQAQAPGCRLAQTQAREIPRAFWLAYAEEKLAKEQTSCGALAAYTDAAKRYGEAMAKNDAKLLAPIAGLKRFIDDGGAAQKELVDLLAADCPPALKAGQTDPWRVCALAAKARAEEEAKRKAEEPPPPPPPPPACAEDLPVRVAKRLGYLSRPRHQACKPMPSTPGRSIVALSSLAQGLEEGEAGSSDDGSYDVDLAVVDSDTGRVQSRLLLEKAYESDAVRFEGVQIDTARYRLSPKVRAFGLRAGHSGSSSAFPSGESALSLFVEEGNRLRRVLTDLVVYTYHGEWDGNCAGHSTQLRRAVAIAPTSSKGFADLLVTTSTAETESHRAGDECQDDSTAPAVTRTLLHFDGKTYPVPNELR